MNKPDWLRSFCRWFYKHDAWDWTVIAFSTFALTQGGRYLAQPSESPKLILDKLGQVPLQMFGVLWFTAGLWAIMSCLGHHRATHALLMQCGLFMFWGVFYVLSGGGIIAQLFIGLGCVAGGFPSLMAMPRLRR